MLGRERLVWAPVGLGIKEQKAEIPLSETGSFPMWGIISGTV